MSPRLPEEFKALVESPDSVWSSHMGWAWRLRYTKERFHIILVNPQPDTYQLCWIGTDGVGTMWTKHSGTPEELRSILVQLLLAGEVEVHNPL